MEAIERDVWRSLARQARLVMLLGALLGLAAFGGSPPVFGTALDGVPAPPFNRVDQHGNDLDLEDLRDKAVALTFISINCLDVCQVTVQNLRQAYDQMPESQRDRPAGSGACVWPVRR